MRKRLPLIFLLFAPPVTWAVFKPIRVVAPEWVEGISCVQAKICVEDVSRIGEAVALYTGAIDDVSLAVGSFQDYPVVVFCSTADCARSFSFAKAAAITVGKLGIVVSPRGWKSYYLRHEMIHHRQAEELGMLRQWRTADWFKEGMAYSLSQDPRATLAEPWQRYRTEFEAWYKKVGKTHLWNEARKL